MPRLKPNNITESDLLEYLATDSDFTFELEVLRQLRSLGIACEHGGLYDDPATQKPRQFDIRAAYTTGKFRVRMAIECKNIRENFPLLICTAPRHPSEAFHQIVILEEPRRDNVAYMPTVFSSRAKAYSLRESKSIYRPLEAVGKATTQVGRALDGTLSTNDSELYEKWGQCLSSAADLVERTYWDGKDEGTMFLSTVVPFVVIPNGRLWTTHFNDEGARTSPPSQSDRCACFVNRSYTMGTKLTSTQLSISHVEIVTVDGLMSFLHHYVLGSEVSPAIFNRD